MVPSCRVAVLQMDFTYSDQVRLEERVTPQYLTVGEGEIRWPAMFKLIGDALLDRLMVSSFVLEWFGVRPCCVI